VGGTDSAEIRVEPPPEQTPCDARPDLCDIAISGFSAVSEPIFVVPSDGLPKEVSVDVANNNLDVIWWKGRFWLAWRTGPYHFAAETVKMYVASSSDLRDWRLEGEVSLGTDVREPQLVILNDQLLFYYAELGKNALAFEPQGTWLLRYKSPGEWTEPVSVFESSFIPWRIRTVGDRLQVFGYTGGENIYEADGEPIDVHWLESSDGLNWYPVVQDQAVVLTGGSSETDAVVLADGTLIGVSRNEAGDSNGFGMKICRAESNALGDWTCVADKKKYDSPLVFEYAGRVFLIGRRNVTETGHYDLDQTELSFEQQSTVNQLDYSGQPKRCSLWTIDTTSLNVSFVLDLPSAGDTCFPEIIELGSGRFIVFNYTSLLGQTEDPSWSTGQFEPTHIYHSVITVPAANASSP
jgi:hypothetical protein